MQGQLSFTNETLFMATAEEFKDIATYPNVKLTFNDGAALGVGSGDILALENLTFASQVVMNGVPILVLETTGSNVETIITPQFNITAAANPNLVEFMKRANVMVSGGNNNWADLQGEGILLGDGRYLINYSDSHKGLYLRAETTAKISAVGGAGTVMGIACGSDDNNDYLGVYIPIDANGATLQLQNDQVMDIAHKTNKRVTEAPNNNLYMRGPIEDTPEIKVLNNGVDFDPGITLPAGVKLSVATNVTLDLNTAVTVDTIAGEGSIKDASFLTFDTVAPGMSAGALDMGDFTMLNGATYEFGIDAPPGTAGVDYDLIQAGTTTFTGSSWTLQIVKGPDDMNLDGTEVFTIIDGDSAVDFSAGDVTIESTEFGVSGASVYQEGGDIKLTGVTGGSGTQGTVILVR